MIIFAAALGITGQPEACGAFLLAGIGLVYHGLGWPTVPELLAGRHAAGSDALPPGDSGAT